MLAYALTPHIKFSPQIIAIKFLGVDFSFAYTFQTLISLMVTILAFTGMRFLLQTHPLHNNRRIWQHSLLPSLTAWAIGIPLNNFQVNLAWWGIFFLGGSLLIMVFVAEYIILDPEDIHFPPAAVAITALSFALFFLLAVGARSSNLRLFLTLPLLVLPVILIVLRTLFLRHSSHWYISWSLAISMFIGCLTIGLHYLPLTPVKYGLILLGCGYGITNLAGNLVSESSGRFYWMEPALVALLFVGLSLVLT